MDKILIVDFNSTAPTYTYYFAKGLQGLGLHVDVLGVENRKFTRVHNDNSINYVGFDFGNRLFNYFVNWVKLILISKQYDVIHIQWLPMLNYSSIELYFVKILKSIQPNLYYTVHNFFPHDELNIKIKERYLKLYSLLDNLVVHTELTAEKIRQQIGQKRIIEIKHGYFYSEFKKINQSTRKYDLSMLGSILSYKGVEDAIQAVFLLKSSNIIVNLLVAGKCSETYLNSLMGLIKSKQLQNQVILDIGFLSVKKLLKYYNCTKMSIMPYKEIEQSGVLFTSLGMGVPIVGYKTGGLVNVIRQDYNGFLVQTGDIRDLAKTIEIGINNWENWHSNILEDSEEPKNWLKTAVILKEEYFG